VPFHQFQILSAQYGLTKVNSIPDFGKGNEKPFWEGIGAIPGSTLCPFQASSDTAPAYWVKPAIPELWTILASGAQTAIAYTLTGMLLTKENAAGPMRYDNIDEIYYVLDGSITRLLDHRIEEVWNGDFAFIPRNTLFAVRVDSETARALIWHTPSGIIEGALSMVGAVPAEDRTKRPANLERPPMDPELR
jgi:hypothetical protein